jgi:hypothetical protein
MVRESLRIANLKWRKSLEKVNHLSVPGPGELNVQQRRVSKTHR